MSESWSFLLTAAGSGRRLGGEPKQFRLLSGVPVWFHSAWCAKELYEAGAVKDFVLSIPHEYLDNPDIAKYLERLAPMPCSLAVGAEQRWASVKNGLELCTGQGVLIHDAARPFLKPKLCLDLIECAQQNGAAVPLLPCGEAVKILSPEGMKNADRSNIRLTQTPQAFSDKNKIWELLENLSTSTENKNAFDEAQLWIEANLGIGFIEGDRRLFKITDNFDWEAAQLLEGENKTTRVGHGYDIHPLVPGRALVLGGLQIDYPLGLDGHSDADVVCHAVSDALLGAVGLPDIGTLFPASDERYKGADSLLLLEEVVSLIKNLKNYKKIIIEWVDVTIVAQVPRLGDKLPAIKNNLEKKIGYNKINIKVKSGEHTGSVGRGECMICHAIATLSFTEHVKEPYQG